MESHIFATYLLFDRHVTGELHAKITQRAEELLDDAMKSHSIWSRINLELQSLNDIRFGSTMYVDISPQGNKQTIRVFIILAVFILIIAIANFINLSTARSEKRLVEAGINEVLRSSRFHLICHYIGESVLLTGVGVLLALFAIEIALPAFTYRYAEMGFACQSDCMAHSLVCCRNLAG